MHTETFAAAAQPSPLRCLIIDDNPNDRLLVNRELRREFSDLEVSEVYDAAQFNEALGKGDFDIVITDYHLCWSDGLQVLHAIRERYPEVPVIMFTGTGSEEVAVNAMKSGLSDYVLKSARHYIRLPAAVKSALSYAQERRERRRMEQQFVQAQKMEAIGHLAGGVAHDFNNVLSAVIGYSELLLLSVPQDDPHVRYVNEIKNAGLRAKEITQQLLAFSRKQILELKPIQLDVEVDQMMSMLRRLIGEDIELEVRHERPIGLTRADATQMQQVVLNLAVNARDAMPNGGRITIITKTTEAEELPKHLRPLARFSSYVTLILQDSGHGMEASVLEHLWEPFFTTKKPGRGTGLGLPMVHGIVSQHGGWCEVESEVGLGTTFTIFLPSTDEAEQSEPIPARVEVRPAGNEGVLIVEDDESVRTMVSRVLSLHGYTVVEAEEPNVAIERARQHGSSLSMLITDVIMPKMNGRELFQRIRDIRPDLRVLYMSGYPQDVISHRGELEAGVHFIQKPFSLSSFLQKVRETLDG